MTITPQLLNYYLFKRTNNTSIQAQTSNELIKILTKIKLQNY